MRGDARRFDGDVARGVATADDQHPLPGERGRALVVVRMQEGAVELARVRRHPRTPMMAVGNRQGIERLEALAIAVAYGERPPIAGQRFGAHDVGAETHTRCHPEVRRVRLEVRGQLGV
jgi:hypothetical protein